MALSHLDVFISAIFLICVLVAVVGVLRGGPSIFERFIRGFNNKNPESGGGNQRQVKHVNWKKGMFRLTLVLSVPLAWLFGGDIGEEWFGSGMRGFFTGVLIFFLLIWLVYFLIGPAIIRAITFIMKGFMDKN